MARHFNDVTFTCLLLLLIGSDELAAQSMRLPRSTVWRVNTAAQVAADLPALNVPAPAGRIIFIGVHGGNPPTWDNAE